MDAVVVLGGEHDGREEFGIALARRLGAATVLLSNPYPADDPTMRPLCSPRTEETDVRILCFVPDPSTTHGEASATRRFAQDYGWSSVAVVTWRYHLPRARLVFHRCLDDRDVRLTAVAAPHDYRLSVVTWEYLFAYQFAGMAKAVTERC